MQASDITKDIKEKALQLGYASCGIIPTESFDGYSRRVDERTETFPHSKELYERLYNRVNFPEDARSVIVCVRGFSGYKVPGSLRGRIGKFYLFHDNIAYSEAQRAKAEFSTYLRILGLRDFKLAPPDRWAAVNAGLGKFGRNNFIFTQEHGSYVSIDTWTVDLALDFDSPTDNKTAAGCSEGCLKCVEACPTKALSGSFSMDWGKCVTHLMYKKTLLKEDQRTQMGSWLYGCDACQDVCPMNHGKLTEEIDFPLLADFEKYLTLDALWVMDEATYLEVIHPRFWFTGKDGLIVWKRNALRAMINSGDKKYHPAIRDARTHADDIIRELAEWGCNTRLLATQ